MEFQLSSLISTALERVPQQLALCRNVERLPNAQKNAVLGNAAGISFIYGFAQSGKFCFVLLLLAFQRPECRAYYFAGVLVAATLHFS